MNMKQNLLLLLLGILLGTQPATAQEPVGIGVPAGGAIVREQEVLPQETGSIRVIAIHNLDGDWLLEPDEPRISICGSIIWEEEPAGEVRWCSNSSQDRVDVPLGRVFTVQPDENPIYSCPALDFAMPEAPGSYAAYLDCRKKPGVVDVFLPSVFAQ